MVQVPAPVTAHGCSDALRLRRCCDPSCNALFAICRGCDHGQRYCSAACRKRRRQQQMRTASRRYQATEAGKLTHRCRQRAYRRRSGQAHVTHQGESSVKPPPRPTSNLSQCAICGRESRWNDPFEVLPRAYGGPRRRRRRRDAQISTFLHDR